MIMAYTSDYAGDNYSEDNINFNNDDTIKHIIMFGKDVIRQYKEKGNDNYHDKDDVDHDNSDCDDHDNSNDDNYFRYYYCC